jgi:hypothetical protein
MASTKRLPPFFLGGIHEGPVISLVTRVLIAVAIDILVVTAVLLAKDGATLTVVPTVAFAYIVTGALVGAVDYLFWRPRYSRAP